MKNYQESNSEFFFYASPVRVVLILMISLSLAGCGSLVDFGGGEPPAIYRLSPTQTSSPGVGGGWSIQIDQPTIIAALRGDEIAVTKNGSRIEYYADAIWVDRTARVVQRFLLERFEDAPDVFATSMGNLPTDWTLQLDIRDFTAHADDDQLGATVTLNVSAMLLQQAKPVAVRGQKKFLITVTASTQMLDAVVPAFGRALEKLASDILRWVDELAD